MQKFLLSFAVVLVGGVAVAATLFLKQISYSKAQTLPAPTVATCQTGYNRPLLFGVSGDGSPSSYEGELKNAGSTLATVGINWDHDTIQGRGPQDYNPESVNFPIRKAVQSGLVVVVNISGTPNWASGNPGLPPHKAQPNKDDTTVNREFRELVTQAVHDNKTQVKYWTYWNEPNGCMSSAGDCGYTGDSLEDFAYWHKVFYDTVKAEDPTAQVIFANLDFTGPHTSFIRDVHKLNFDIEYDYLGLNVYDKNKNAKLAIDWARQGYDAQPSDYKKPVWLNEWGFDTLWWDCDDDDDACEDRARQDVAVLVEDGFNKLYAADFIAAAQYHNLRDRDGDYGLWSSNGPRPGGVKFKQISDTKCNPAFSTGGTPPPTTGPPPNKPIVNGEIPITIRTHYKATMAENQWPKVVVLLNNASGYKGAYDEGKCDGSYTGAAGTNFCGTTNTYDDRRVDTFDATGTSYRDLTLNASQLVPNLATGVGTTKLSYAFYNDRFIDGQDRNVHFTKIEIFGPATDNSNQSRLLLSFNAEQADSFFGGYGDPTNLINSFYFDMGFIEADGTQNANNDGLVYGFDKAELRTIKQANSREDKAWKLDQEGTFNFVSQELQKVISTIYEQNTQVGACIIASHDIGSDFLKKGQPMTLTSVANVGIKTFKYAFYNSDNKNAQGIANPFCVAGAPTSPGCPAGSGQLIIQSNGANNREGAIQAASWLKVPNGQVLDSIWRGDIGWNRRLDFDETLGGIDGTTWNLSGYLGFETFGTFRSAAEIDALDFYGMSEGKGAMEIWRNNKGSRTTFNFNSAGNYPDWSTAQTHEFVDLNKTPEFYPGNGLVTAAGSFTVGNKVWQVLWRGNQEMMRSVQLADVGKQAHAQSKYSETRNSSSLPVPNVRVQAVNYMLMPDGRVQEEIWLNDQAYQRFIPVTNGTPAFASASDYRNVGNANNMTQPSNQTNSVHIEYNKIHVVDTLTGKIPENVQINATFTTDTDGTIRDDGKCVARFAFDKSVDGDVDGNCVNDIYDYNILLQYYGTNNCQYNLAGNDCRIDQADIDYLKERFGDKCE